jgi:hypothetical protein
MEYRIQQKATVWYETIVQADTEEEALKQAESNDNDYHWEMLLDTVVFEEEYEIEED